MTQSRPAQMMVIAGKQALAVTDISGGKITLGGAIDAAAAAVGRFTLVLARGATRISVPFSGQAGANGGDIEYDRADAASLAAALRAAIHTSPETLRTVVASAKPHASGRPRVRANLVATALLVVGCALLASYVGGRMLDKVGAIEARVAYLATDAQTIMSPTSGRVSFAAQGAVDAGEPVFGIETASGRSVLLDSPGDLEVIATEKAIGDRVNRGDLLLALAAPDAALYLRAVVNREQAFKLAEGARLHYQRLDVADAPVTRLEVASDAIDLRELGIVEGELLYEMRIAVTTEDGRFRALPVKLWFDRDFGEIVADAVTSLGVPSDWVKSWRQNEGSEAAQ